VHSNAARINSYAPEPPAADLTKFQLDQGERRMCQPVASHIGV
jgi:hypothetical protein